jgi:hypothetical protein
MWKVNNRMSMSGFFPNIVLMTFDLLLLFAAFIATIIMHIILYLNDDFT